MYQCFELVCQQLRRIKLLLDEPLLKMLCWCEHSCLHKLETSFSAEVTWGHCSIVFMTCLTRPRQLQPTTWKIAVKAQAFPLRMKILKDRICGRRRRVAVLLMLVPGSSLVRKLSHKTPHTALQLTHQPTTPHSSTSAGPLRPFNTAGTYFGKQNENCEDLRTRSS